MIPASRLERLRPDTLKGRGGSRRPGSPRSLLGGAGPIPRPRRRGPARQDDEPETARRRRTRAPASDPPAPAAAALLKRASRREHFAPSQVDAQTVPPPGSRRRHLSMGTRVVLRRQASLRWADAERRERKKRSLREEDSRGIPGRGARAPPTRRPQRDGAARFLLPPSAPPGRPRRKQETDGAAASGTLPGGQDSEGGRRLPRTRVDPRQTALSGAPSAGGGDAGSQSPGEDPLPTSPPALTWWRSRRHATSEEVAGNRPPRPRRYVVRPLAGWDDGCGHALQKHQRAPTSPVSS